MEGIFRQRMMRQKRSKLIFLLLSIIIIIILSLRYIRYIFVLFVNPALECSCSEWSDIGNAPRGRRKGEKGE